MYKSTYHARSPWWLQCHRMDTLPGTSPGSPPGTRRRLNQGNSADCRSPARRSLPRAQASQACSSGTDENIHRLSSPASSASDVCVLTQPSECLPFDTEQTHRSLLRPQGLAVFGLWSQKQVNQRLQTSLSIAQHESTPSLHRWSSMSDEQRRQKIDEKKAWNMLSEAEQRVIVEGKECKHSRKRLKPCS